MDDLLGVVFFIETRQTSLTSPTLLALCEVCSLALAPTTPAMKRSGIAVGRAHCYGPTLIRPTSDFPALRGFPLK